MNGNDLKTNSKRTTALGRHGMVACENPYAAQAGLEILKKGGNAADAAVAIAAVIALVQPCSTGLGGDAFCLFYEADTKKVHSVNGSGRCPAALNLEVMNKDGFNKNTPPPDNHGHTVTVPGAPAAWVDTYEKFGSKKLTLQELLQPAIDLAEEGFIVHQIAAHFWNKGSNLLKDSRNTHGKALLKDGRAPKWGEVFKNPDLAKVLKTIGSKGKAGYYEGPIAQAVTDVVIKFGGVMTLEDLKNHTSSFEDPISVTYKGVRLWEVPPSGQGIVALIALNILESYDLQAMGHNSPAYLHTLIEALKLAFADAFKYTADPTKTNVPIEAMISKEYAAERRKLLSQDKTQDTVSHGIPMGSDTTYFTATDSLGNACSFINSNFKGFGTGIVPEGCGFTLQNRGAHFSLDPDHGNIISPGKRPYHTIIPAMVTKADTGNLLCTYGVMGGFMQPQGHVQLLLNMLVFGMDPQEALDQPRVLVGSGYEATIDSVQIEEGIPWETMNALQEKGHKCVGPLKGHTRSLFGRGQVITKGAWWTTSDLIVDDHSVWWGGSDARSDGIALGY